MWLVLALVTDKYSKAITDTINKAYHMDRPEIKV